MQSAGTTGCTVDSVTAVVSFNQSGSCVVRATASATLTNSEATRDVTFQIGPTSTSITLLLDLAVGESTSGAPVEFMATGLAPESSWNVVVRSTPQTLDQGVVNGSGMVSGVGALPGGLEPGWHTITLSGTRLTGGFVSSTVWFDVAADGSLTAVQTRDPSAGDTNSPGGGNSSSVKLVESAEQQQSVQTDTGGFLSRTGVSPWRHIIVASVLALIGYALVVVARRRIPARENSA